MPVTAETDSGATATTRQGAFWAAEVAVGNATAPWAGDVTAVAVKTVSGSPDLIRTDTRAAYLPAALQQFGYDADGNLATDGRWDYTYDAENRLVQMNTAVASRTLFGGTWQRLKFTYDYLGRRVEKAVLSTNDGVMFTPTLTHRFLYDSWNLIAELALDSQLSTLSLLRSYAWGLDLTGHLTRAGGVGALLQITDHVASKTYWPTYDGNGNVVALLDRASAAGTVANPVTAAAVYEYSPVGELLRSDAKDATMADQPFRFSTKYQDTETGLLYYGHRYYSPAMGRFINRDPIQESGGINLYGFAGNDGVNGWDFLGTFIVGTIFHETLHPIGLDELNARKTTDQFAGSLGLPRFFPNAHTDADCLQTSGGGGSPGVEMAPQTRSNIAADLNAHSVALSGWDCSRVGK